MSVSSLPCMNPPQAGIAEFELNRSLLFGIAYRMLGSICEAEDMLQETFLRWQRQDPAHVRSAKAWLTTAVTRLCIDHLRSARKRREEYVGVWLPEPLLESHAHAPIDPGSLADSLNTAFLVLLETLSPVERAVFLLREVFAYDYAEISRVLEKSEANCRQLFRRARERVAAREPRFEADPARKEHLVQRFLEVCREGDNTRLMAMLTEDAVIYSDGGGKVSAAPAPIVGAQKVARFLVGVNKLRRAVDFEVRFATLNAAPGLLMFEAGRLVQTNAFEFSGDRVAALYIVRNPEKLVHLHPRS